MRKRKVLLEKKEISQFFYSNFQRPQARPWTSWSTTSSPRCRRFKANRLTNGRSSWSKRLRCSTPITTSALLSGLPWTPVTSGGCCWPYCWWLRSTFYCSGWRPDWAWSRTRSPWRCSCAGRTYWTTSTGSWSWWSRDSRGGEVTQLSCPHITNVETFPR